MFTVRQAIPSDLDSIFTLYKKVAEAPVGIARSPAEVSETYIQQFMSNAAATGVELVIGNPSNPAEIIAEIHCSKYAPAIFKHVLGDLTIAVHPGFQGKGLGKLIFTHLLQFITANKPDIFRVELFTQESNERALALYTKLGFTREGRFEKRIPGLNGLEADIPMAWFNPAYIA